MDRTELAWAAGFWDGEGSAYLTGALDRRTRQPQARINQAGTAGVPEVLNRFQRVTGLGVIQGPDVVEGREPLYRWAVSSRRDVEWIARALAPWLGGVKRSQFEDALDLPLPACDWSSLPVEECRGWAAGLWDGEGSVCLLKHRSHAGHFVPEASVTQSSDEGVPEVLERLASIGPVGFRYGPFAQPPPWSPVYRWKLFRYYEIRGLFDLLWPWLGEVKRAQALAVFDVLEGQPKLARGNPAWGNRKTHCVNGHEYAGARVRPFRGRGVNTEAPRESSKCLQCLREYARDQRAQERESRGPRHGSRSRSAGTTC